MRIPKLSQLLMVLLASSSIGVASANTKIPKKHNVHYNAKTPKKSKKHVKKNYMLGTASFYGENDGFDGQQMANGNIFDTNDVHSAAHPTLALGTKLMVTNLANGRTIYVEVRDRMPKHGRVIDLSTAAAMYLGMHHKGLTKVELVRISDEEFEQNKHYLEVLDNDNGIQG
jgi:rare lipoprotein A